MGACGHVDRMLYSRSEGLGFDSQCWPCVEVSGKLCIPHCLGPPSHNGYLAHRSKVGSIVAGCCAPTARGGKVWSQEYLDSKQIPLPLFIRVLCRVDTYECSQLAAQSPYVWFQNTFHLQCDKYPYGLLSFSLLSEWMWRGLSTKYGSIFKTAQSS